VWHLQTDTCEGGQGVGISGTVLSSQDELTDYLQGPGWWDLLEASAFGISC
jgi:hypothetical protein